MNIQIFEYFPIRIFVRIIFVSFFLYKYIRIFVRIVFLIQIYSHIRWYHFFDTNIFGYSFALFFDTNIFKRKNLTWAPKSPKVKWLILFTQRLICRKITSLLLCQLCFNFLLYHTSKIQHLTTNQKPYIKIWYKYIRKFKYFPIQIFVQVKMVDDQQNVDSVCFPLICWEFHFTGFDPPSFWVWPLHSSRCAIESRNKSLVKSVDPMAPKPIPNSSIVPTTCES